MPDPPREEIYRDMTQAFERKCRRTLSTSAKAGLRHFILEAVIKGVEQEPGCYPEYREYLMCRFEFIGEEINRNVDPARNATWRQLIRAGSAEARTHRPECDIVLGKRGVAERADPERDVRIMRRICKGFDETSIPVPPDPDGES